jgi:hypothetical protein
LNIFYLHNEPVECAKQHCDKHVVKMIVETAQLLSTAHRVIDGSEFFDVTEHGRKIRRWKLDDERESVMYKATHINHPSAQWVRQSSANYYWLHALFTALCMEYSHRYKKVHKTEDIIDQLNELPYNINYGTFTPPTPAMPDEYKVEGDVIQSYRNYYLGSKRKIAVWTNRDVPSWFN